MGRFAKRFVLGEGAREYAGPHRVVIDAEADGGIVKGQNWVFIANEQGQLMQWGLEEVIPHPGALQLTLLHPDDHDHRFTMFVWPDGSVRFNGGEYEPLPEISENPIWAIPFSG